MGVAAAAAVVGTAATAYSAYQGRQAGRRAGRAMDEQAAAQQRALDMQEQFLDWSMGEYNQWREEFRPVLDQLKMEAMAGQTPDYAAITADTMSAFASARDQTQRQQQRFGINPGDGQWGATEARFGIGQATAEVGARQQARRANEGQQFGKLAQVYGIGAGLQQGAMGMAGSAFGGVSNAHSNMAGMHGNQANYHGNQANMYGQIAAESGAAAFGQWADIIDGAMNSPEPSRGGFDRSGMPWAGQTGGDP